jgi:hypothetical protein
MQNQLCALGTNWVLCMCMCEVFMCVCIQTYKHAGIHASMLLIRGLIINMCASANNAYIRIYTCTYIHA